MFPSPDFTFSSVHQFVWSLSDDQRRFYLGLELDREQRLQSALRAASEALSGISGLISDSIQIRLSDR